MVGEKVAKFRKILGISQRELGRRTGLSGQMISKIENNLTNPSLETLGKIASVLNVNLNNLLDMVKTPDCLIVNDTSLDINYLLDNIRELIMTNKDNNKLIYESFDSLVTCFMVLFLPFAENPKEHKNQNVTLLNELMFEINQLIESDGLISPYNYPDDYLENSGKTIHKIYTILEKIRLLKFSSRKYRNNMEGE
ncbi:helix-turn-helix transcriptional regulator [Clostridium botulinum]|uniref:Adenine-specific DNA methyltransferase n=1 Tax=Clostridium botulinum (strain Eklund 17B / Type B) TaxID=935198 RepID=B2THD4_CLOBB|nr:MULTISPECIES: helix-turn-helix transcriptional regulator [Clostridium]ACD23218.1 adenine-specific DNA methyltransferase [Clostridium botulinum B str. Eklund 17B (NRP)]MBY6977431.1 helix-turn-helix transcriptional regulator [Clostridium botulinum]MBY7001986.1 helix-turn-helix transcriptional regulator [Clostridium botulinum]MCR1275567.1 helix-turn-helix domain-containing protein [Clostridium botulinum]MCS6131421.1 XRE family transcriptional regulator [Clostridium botulinum]